MISSLGNVIDYVTMPDATTIAQIAARGDTINIVPAINYALMNNEIVDSGAKSIPYNPCGPTPNSACVDANVAIQQQNIAIYNNHQSALITALNAQTAYTNNPNPANLQALQTALQNLNTTSTNTTVLPSSNQATKTPIPTSVGNNGGNIVSPSQSSVVTTLQQIATPITSLFNNGPNGSNNILYWLAGGTILFFMLRK